MKKRVTMKGVEDRKYILAHRHCNTWEVVATEPDTCSLMLGSYVVNHDGKWLKGVSNDRKDKFGRLKQGIRVVELDFETEEDI
jgi:hypothetical protein